jgi:hypothetical protein
MRGRWRWVRLWFLSPSIGRVHVGVRIPDVERGVTVDEDIVGVVCFVSALRTSATARGSSLGPLSAVRIRGQSVRLVRRAGRGGGVIPSRVLRSASAWPRRSHAWR